MRFTFRRKLFIYFMAITLSISIPIAIITYDYIYDSQKSDIFSSTAAQMVQIDNNFTNRMNQIKEDTKFLADYPDIKNADQSIVALFNMSNIDNNKKYSSQVQGIESTIYNHFKDYGTNHLDTSHVFLATKWGGYVQWPDGVNISKFDPRLRPWYIQAFDNPEQVAVSEPYASYNESNTVIISASSTIKNKSGNIIGVLGIDVSLDKLSEMIRDIKIGDSGYVFLYLKDGTMLAHPNSEINFKNILQLNMLGHTLAETNDSISNPFENYNKFIDENNGSFETIINGEPVLVNVYTSKYTGWKMASVIPKSELVSKANKIGYIIMLIALIALLLLILITYIITKKLTKPITELTPLMHAAGNGDFTVSANIKSNDEFGQLGESFNLMIGKLNASYEELSQLHEELLATEEELREQYEELQYNEEALKNSEERYRLALECANDSIWEWDLVTGEFFASDKLREIAGYKLGNIRDVVTMINKIVHPDDVDKAKEDFKNHINEITEVYNSEFRLKSNGGAYIWILARGRVLRDLDGKALKIAGSISDISNRKVSEDKIKFMAFYDSLTKLPNRTSLINVLNEQLELVKRKNIKGAVLFIDLDNFKNINDTIGHDYGDKLLIHLGKQFNNLIDEKDTICRLGGDEFILLHSYEDEVELDGYAKRFLDLFNEPIKIGNKQMFITASIGMALYPKDGTDANTILKNADSAMYKAKELGKNRYVLFNPDIYLKLERRTNIERILRSAIKNNELSINYQPQYDAKKNEIFGFEALLRLNSKELGLISPAEFIPIAEECGYITNLSRWVINESCRQSVEWMNAGYKFKSMSINISSVDIQQPDFLDSIKGILASTGINPNVVELEITETVLMESFDSSINILETLIDMGIRIALDDFGTGYSSLNYLGRIPISTLKIDKSFIDDITSSKKRELMIKNIIQMAHSMDLKVVAEGVESKEQLSILKERNCNYIQGYYYSKPLPESEIKKLLA